MSFPVDYSESWRVLDGVLDATLRPPASETDANVKARKDVLTAREISGGAFGIAPTDDAFWIWGAAPQQEGRLTIGAESWTVLQVTARPDGAYWRITARKRV